MSESRETETPKLRGDLIRRQIFVGRTLTWVLADPMTRSHYYFSRRDFDILRRLDGRQTLAQVSKICSAAFSPDYLSIDALRTFVADAREKGLLQSTDSLSSRRQSRISYGLVSKLKNPLAIRLPGINPNALLSHVVAGVRPLVDSWAMPWIVASVVVFLLCGLVTGVVHFGAIADEAAAAASRIDTRWLLTIGVVVIVTKIIHELAHALTCKLMGGDARELGVMLLAGMPCLYCDVSDAWLIDRPWKRSLVSAAGIIAELVIASSAVLVWQFTGASDLRDLCVIVMVICSISTVVINANPLMRYDGYFILSDLCGMPNLSAEASAVIRSRLRRLLLPKTQVSRTSAAGVAGRRHVPSVEFALGVYAVCSVVYRIFVLCLLGGIFIAMLDRIGLKPVGYGVVVTYLMFLLSAWACPILRQPQDASMVSGFRRRRWIVFGGVFLGLLVLVHWPLPRSIQSTAVVAARDTETLRAVVGGILSDGVQNGSAVEASSVVVKIKNIELARELAEAEAVVARLRSQIDGLSKQRTSNRSPASTIRTLRESLDSAVRQVELKSKQVDRLTIRAEQQGRFVAAPERPLVRPVPISRQLVGTIEATSLVNRGGQIAAGETLGTIQYSRRRKAWAFVPRSDVESVEAGQSVQLFVSGYDRGSLSGTVINVGGAEVQARQLSGELANRFDDLAAALQAMAEHDSSGHLVQIELNESCDGLPVGLTAQVRIESDRTSIWRRLCRYWLDTVVP